MKTRNHLLFILLGMCSLLNSCKGERTEREDSQKSNTPNHSKKTIVCTDEFNPKDYELPSNLIREMVQTYENRQLKTIERTLKMEDAKGIWFELKTLKEFICYIEYLVYKNDPSLSIDDLGLRMYYASYPEKLSSFVAHNALVGLDGYKGRHTLVMVPTLIKPNTDNDMKRKVVDIDAKNKDTYGTGISGMEEYFDESGKPLISFTVLPPNRNIDSSITAKNHGGLFPPDDQSGAPFAN